ncbi:16S rRNA (adenine(1518)-N(6)/adenine(1519)-N(6))-dimethyltransferase RsmA [Metamycoplasma gateae]|uniref:Ribosomal RNA small subunit methyltransferase A n=1 Tax=Metamycoplasma gateae TaxID=35769 RepID=A0ABZ2AHM6_9BACT|nr:16S rRNA (adenine(1518)-N(6)/adenine(1519)-N(6))-dimethyltransferase RsmA [Metamycoplasma gateae]
MEIKAKKSFGQNFLINKKIQNKIIDSSNIENEDVIEIGPGLGALTNLLINKVKSLVAYELDKEIYEMWISKNLGQKIKFINQDFLEANLYSIDKRVVVGNIPYNITSPILFKLIENKQYIKSATIMIQKEVGDRLIAKPNNKSYSKLTVSLQSVANVQKILIAKSSDFNPAPKVDSMVVKIDFNIDIDFELEKYLDFIKRCFQFKRKTLMNNLITSYDKDKLLKVFQKNQINLLSRPESLEIKQYISLFKDLVI